MRPASMNLGFVFPGQGSQFVGMLADAAAAYDSVQARFAEASDAIGIDLWAIASEGPAAALAATEIAQPALLAASVALWDIWRRNGGSPPELMAGHSLGEYSALVCAASLDFTDAVRLVHRRGQLMQQAVPKGEGAMAAVLGIDATTVEAVCAQIAASGSLVSAANYNAPGQTVIAGTAKAVQQAASACKEQGAKRAVMLDVSGPFHCALMLPAREELAAALDRVNFRPPSIPVVHNVTAAPATTVGAVRQSLLSQLSEPVRWVECVERMVANGVTHLIECGPGKVLAGMAKRIERSLTAASIGTLDSLAKELEACKA